MRLAEAGVVTIGQELINRFAVAIGSEKISKGIKGQTKRIHLPVRIMLDARAVEPNAICVPRIHMHLVPVVPLDVGIVIVAVSAIQPAVKASPEARLVAVRVA